MKTEAGRLLIIENELAHRETLCKQLLDMGYTVFDADDEQTALAICREHRLDLVLIGADLPEMDGGDLLRRLKAERALEHVPLILVAIGDDLDTVANLIDKGAEDYLQAPFNPVLLQTRLNDSIDKKRLRDQSMEYAHLVDDLKLVILPTGVALSVEDNFERLLEKILQETKNVSNADAGTLYIRMDDDTLKFAIMSTDSLGIAMGGTTGKEIPFKPLPMYDPVTHEPNHHNVASYVALHGQSVNIPDIYNAEGFDFTGAMAFDQRNGYRSTSSLTVPLKNKTEVIGVLQLLNAIDPITGEVIPFNPYQQLVVETLAAQAAVALNSQLLRRRQEWLLKLERDVQIGRQIQTDFLPTNLPSPAGWEIAARFHPAREVAGDFYDAFNVANNRVGLVIADVCDKGVGAALFMALMRSLLRAFAQQHHAMDWENILAEDAGPGAVSEMPAEQRRIFLTPGAVNLHNSIQLTNDYVADNHANLNMFATMFFAILEPVGGNLLYVNGGHNPPAIIDPQGVIKKRLPPTGPAVGMLSGSTFTIAQAKLEPGDTLMAFTDGVTDARNPQGKLFHESSLLPLLQQPAESATALLDRVDSALSKHIADAVQFDDITMLAARRLPKR